MTSDNTIYNDLAYDLITNCKKKLDFEHIECSSHNIQPIANQIAELYIQCELEGFALL